MSWHDELVNWFVYSLSKSPETIRYCLVFAETVSQSLSLVLLYIFTQSQLFEELQGFSLYNSFPVTLLYCCGYHTFFYYLFINGAAIRQCLIVSLWFLHSTLLHLVVINFLILNAHESTLYTQYETYLVWPHIACNCCECFPTLQCRVCT